MKKIFLLIISLSSGFLFAQNKVGIGTTSPQQNLSINDGLNIDQSSSNSGTTTNALTFGNASGEGIGSKRSAGGNLFGLDFYTNFINHMVITQSGRVGIGTTTPTVLLDVAGNIKTTGDITVQTDKAIIRSNTSTPQKLITISGPLGLTLGAGGIVTLSLVYEAFSAAPTIYVGNISGTGDMAKVLVTCINVGVSSCNVNFYNPSASSITFNGTFNFVAVGAQ